MFKSKHINRLAAQATGLALLLLAQAAPAADGGPAAALERWRSYSGVSWEAGPDPAPFAGSVGAP
ncbi:MAG TPA: hypothetical protein VJN44_18775, partial [Roseateles sp.]|nr:hypothetical protein [Roseateles sp.]